MPQTVPPDNSNGGISFLRQIRCQRLQNHQRILRLAVSGAGAEIRRNTQSRQAAFANKLPVRDARQKMATKCWACQPWK